MDQRNSKLDGRQTITIVGLLSFLLLLLGVLANPALLSLVGHSTSVIARAGKSGMPVFQAMMLIGALGSCITAVLRIQAQKIRVLEWEISQLKSPRTT